MGWAEVERTALLADLLIVTEADAPIANMTVSLDLVATGSL